MVKTKRKSPSGLLSEAGKKAARAIGDVAKRVTGKKRSPRAKSPGGNLSEAAKKAGRGVMDAARKVVGKRPTRRAQKSASR